MLIGLSGFGGLGDAEDDCNNNPNTIWNPVTNTCDPFGGGASQSMMDSCNANPATYWDPVSNSCKIVPAGPSGSTNAAQKAAAQAQAQSSGSWWQGAITALTKGVVQGSSGPTIVPCISPGVPAGCVTLPTVTPPWYTTPIGLVGIALTLGLGYVVLKK